MVARGVGLMVLIASLSSWRSGDMSTVRCRHCGKMIDPAEARPRGALWKGYACSACYWRRFRITFVVLVITVFVLIPLAVLAILNMLK